MSAEVQLTAGVRASETLHAACENRFLLATVAFRRVLQIRDGSRPRVVIASRKAVVQAVAEVLAGCVPYSSS